MAKTLSTIQEIQNELDSLSENNSLTQAQRVILSVIRLLDDSVSVDNNKMFELFNVDNQKISANANWFYEDSVMVDRRATYKIHGQNSLNIDFKLYGLTKPSKRTISWIQALTPNFEDELFNSKYSIGIDFVVPKSADKVIIVLSDSYVIRTLELKGTLTVTFQEILSKWASISDFNNKKEVHAILWESFDLQPLNKKFYAGISERFITLRQHLTKSEVLDEKHASLFANRLLGRVIFCWFLDKKGIINNDRKYFDSESFESDNEYYKTKLENLFFGVLNTPIPDREYKDEVTPFLNGGLFEARDTDLYKSEKITFPKNYFDDLFGFLSAYNFTTDESTSQFQQVAIDPEMLGRIFENLLAEMTEEDGGQARKAKGAFYTPREIVDYMCRESLKEYLKTKLPEDEHRDQRLEQLIDRPDKEFQDQDHNWRRDWKPYKDAIIDALDELKVLDPACGSGAFPIGMLQLLVKVYERLEARFDPYKTKLQIIEKNIYGVDIEPMAVEIARLRTWLSIIVDEEADSGKIKPLPNLEFKFVCANSLVDLDQSGQAVLYGEDPELESKLRDIRDSYFKTESLNKKRKLKSDYEKLVRVGDGLFGTSEKSKQLKTYRPFDNESSASFFNSEFMFGVKSLDIVIANPPYVRQEKFTAIKDSLKKQYGNFYNGRADLYTFFIKLGFNLLKDKGVFAYITSNKFFVRGYGVNTRVLLTKDVTVKKIINFGELPVFQASVDSAIIIAVKKVPSDTESLNFAQAKSATDIYNINNFFTLKNENIAISDLNDEEWSLQNPEKIKVLQKIKKDKKGLELFYGKKIFAGIKTGYDDAFVIDENTKNKLIEIDNRNKDLIKPWLRGKDVRKWKVDYKRLYIIYIPLNKVLIDEYESIKEHLSFFRTHLEKRATNQKWYEMQQPQERFTALFEMPKIIYPDCAKEMRASYDDTGSYGTMAMYFIPYNPIIMGILNSKLFDWFARMSFATFGDPWNGGRVIFKSIYMSKVPIPDLDNKIATLIKEKVEEVIKSVNMNDTSTIKSKEKEIDDLVMELYGLTEDEKNVIYNSYQL